MTLGALGLSDLTQPWCALHKFGLHRWPAGLLSLAPSKRVPIYATTGTHGGVTTGS